jgi:3'-5' exoribonuclease
MTRRRNESIRNFEEGDNVQGFAFLAKKELRQDRNNRDYYDLELKDAGGSIVGKVWSDSPALASDYEAHDFVAFKGVVQSYRDQLQLNVRECRRTVDEDRRHGFDEALLMPSTRHDIDELQQRLHAIFSEELERPLLRRLAAETLEVHGDKLTVHPAAKLIHHAYRGGLLEHVVSMSELALKVCEHYPELDKDVVLLGVLFHDLGKLQELGAMPANDYTTEGRLVGHVVIGRDLLRQRCQAIPDFPTELQVHLEHLVLAHQGRLEFGSPVQPMTAEAFALHFIDDLDSKLAQLRQARESDPALQFLRGFGRYVYTVIGSDEDKRGADPVAADEETASEPEQPELDL